MASEVLPENIEMKDVSDLIEESANCRFEQPDKLDEEHVIETKKPEEIIVLEDQIVIVDKQESDVEESDESILEDKVDTPEGEQLEKEVRVPENYSKHTELYKNFMNAAYSIGKVFRNYTYDFNEVSQTFHHGDDVLSAQRGYELTRSIEGNKLMGAPHNFVDPDEVDRYKMKKIMDKFYRSLVRVHAKMAGIL